MGQGYFKPADDFKQAVCCLWVSLTFFPWCRVWRFETSDDFCLMPFTKILKQKQLFESCNNTRKASAKKWSCLNHRGTMGGAGELLPTGKHEGHVCPSAHTSGVMPRASPYLVGSLDTTAHLAHWTALHISGLQSENSQRKCKSKISLKIFLSEFLWPLFNAAI